jgi:hypothetical protein
MVKKLYDETVLDQMIIIKVHLTLMVQLHAI